MPDFGILRCHMLQKLRLGSGVNSCPGYLCLVYQEFKVGDGRARRLRETEFQTLLSRCKSTGGIRYCPGTFLDSFFQKILAG